MRNKIKEQTGFHYYLLINIWLCNFDSFGTEYISQEVLNKIKDKPIFHNILRIQDDDSAMCRFYCIAFIEYMLAGKTLLDSTNLFSPRDYKKNNKII